MVAFFNRKGVPAVTITDNRDQVIKDFRESRYTVALFNEGIDFSDLQVLLFLRSKESKTVFFQQLGRGLRLCGVKNKVVIIDFIENYKKVNNLRKYLSKGSTEKVNPKNGRVEKIEYQYLPNCEVIFNTEVEEILDRQDTVEKEITKEDLIDAYTLSEQLNRRPLQEEINREGEFKVSRYLSVCGLWVAFLRGNLLPYSKVTADFDEEKVGVKFIILESANSIDSFTVDEDEVVEKANEVAESEISTDSFSDISTN